MLIALALVAATLPVCDAVWRDEGRGRDIPVRIRLPAGRGRVPLVIYSHGLGGDVNGGTLWARAWVDAGIAVIHVQHHGSDIAVYADAPTPADIPQRVAYAASGQQLVARVGDVRFVLNEATRRPAEGGCDLTRLDPDRVGIAGHSMGAWVTQAVSGQYFAGASRLVDRRFRAAVALSPTAPDPSPAAVAGAFGRIGTPVLSITGSDDGVPATATAEQRAAALAYRSGPYRGMPAGQKYFIVFAGGDHLVFSGSSRRAERPADTRVKAATIAATTAFWRATFLGDRRAGKRLAAGLPGELASDDRFEAK